MERFRSSTSLLPCWLVARLTTGQRWDGRKGGCEQSANAPPRQRYTLDPTNDHIPLFHFAYFASRDLVNIGRSRWQKLAKGRETRVGFEWLSALPISPSPEGMMTVFSCFSLHAATFPLLPFSLPFFLFYFYFSGPTEAPTRVHSGIWKIYHRMFPGCWHRDWFWRYNLFVGSQGKWNWKLPKIFTWFISSSSILNHVLLISDTVFDILKGLRFLNFRSS